MSLNDTTNSETPTNLASHAFSGAKFFISQQIRFKYLAFSQTKTPQQGQGVFGNTSNYKT
jgi:hypothetical protein